MHELVIKQAIVSTELICRFPYPHRLLHHRTAGICLWRWSSKCSKARWLSWWGRWKPPRQRTRLSSQAHKMGGCQCWKRFCTWCGRHSSQNQPASTPQQWWRIPWKQSCMNVITNYDNIFITRVLDANLASNGKAHRKQTLIWKLAFMHGLTTSSIL